MLGWPNKATAHMWDCKAKCKSMPLFFLKKINGVDDTATPHLYIYKKDVSSVQPRIQPLWWSEKWGPLFSSSKTYFQPILT